MREIDAYTHDKDTRKNNPRAGLATHDSVFGKVQTYSFDVHYSPTLDWAGKAENSLFDVTVSSIHIHDTVIPQRVIGRFQKAAPETQQGFLFPEADPFQMAQERIKAKSY